MRCPFCAASGIWLVPKSVYHDTVFHKAYAVEVCYNCDNEVKTPLPVRLIPDDVDPFRDENLPPG